MPFAYFGAKHGLAAKYPAPVFPRIIEPFAGSAGYSVHHRSRLTTLIEREPGVAALWREMQSLTPERLREADMGLTQPRTSDPLLMLLAGGNTSLRKVQTGDGDIAVTPRMQEDWWYVRKRIATVAPLLPAWKLIEGDYRDAPNIEATWFIDPPYQPNGTEAGSIYGANDLDYDELADWCRSRKGQVIVCEQAPAAWLPFRALARQRNGYAGATSTTTRTEVVWIQNNANATRRGATR